MPDALTPEVRESVNQALVLADSAQAVVVTTAEHYCQAGEIRKRLRSVESQLEAKRKELTGPILAIKKSIDDFFNKPKEKLTAAIKRIDRGMLDFQIEMKRKAAEEEARLWRAAKIAEEAERKRLTELAAKAVAENKPLAAAVAAKQAEEVQAPVVHVAVPVVKVERISTRKVWRWRVTDKTKVPLDYLILDEPRIGQIVRTMHEATNIQGIEVYAEDILAGR